MSDPITIPVGDIQFLDNSVPALTAGEYLVDVTHTINEPSYSINSTYNAQQKFIVNAPRFTLPAATIQSCFPVPNSESDFHENLPFIVFNDPNLPWARSLVGGDALTYPPSWLTLMIFKPSELVYTVPAAPAQPNPTYSTIYGINDILQPGGNTIGPAITLNDYEQSLTNLSASTIDVAGTTFQALVPQLDELPFLAHLREINTGGQTIDGLTGVGSYSVLLGNRLPDPAGSLYMAHLVSLEGWESYLPGATQPKSFEAGQNARLISLSSWTFTSDAEGPDFKEMVNNLSVAPLSLPAPELPNAPTAIQTEIQTRYKNGYVALNYTTRLGENSFAWYRGPFTPNVPVMIENTLPGYLNTSAGGTPLTTSDEAIIYDPVNGVFDLSYATAFETGKMVTLANKSASLAIWSWKKDGIRLLQILNGLLPNAGNSYSSLRKWLLKNTTEATIDWDDIKERLTETHPGHKAFMTYLSESLGKHFTSKGRESESPIRICDKSKLTGHNNPKRAQKHLPGLLSETDISELTSSGKDPYVLIIEKLKSLTEI